MYQIDTRTTQTRAPQLSQTSRNTNPCVSTSTGVIHKANVRRPQLKSTQMKDKVMTNNSQVKFKRTEIEDHHRISSISNKTKSVTACNDNLKSKTSNVNVVCATCGKCLVDSEHFACVTKILNDVNARTKKPNVVPISTRKPKSQANKSVATPPKKTVALESTIQKSKSYYRILYEKTSKTWKWWIEQQCPSGYKWVPKTKMKWVPKVRNENVTKRVSFAIDNASRITNVLKLTNTLGSNLSSVPSSSNSIADCSTHPIHYLVQGNIMINKVYYVEGLSHNLFSVGQFWDADLEKQLHQLQSVSWLKPHQLKHGYGIEGFLILTSTTSTCFQRRMSLTKNSVVERQNRTLAEAARSMLSASKLPLFDEIKEMTQKYVANDTSGLVPQRQKASDYENSGPVPQLQNVSPSTDTIVLLQQELDLLFGPLYDEFFKAEMKGGIRASEGAGEWQVNTDRLVGVVFVDMTVFHNNNRILNTDRVTESSSCNIDNSNMHTFNQPQDSEYRWTKDHPLSQVHGNPSKLVKIR
ncbi:hypothetical protein Tco_0299011 [Tanacetum coccineum]